MGFSWIHQEWYKKELDELKSHIHGIKQIIEFINSQGDLVGSDKIKSQRSCFPVDLKEYVIKEIKKENTKKIFIKI